eukprot:69623-Alexandrium_andersonii.AAC.1
MGLKRIADCMFCTSQCKDASELVGDPQTPCEAARSFQSRVFWGSLCGAQVAASKPLQVAAQVAAQL